jgi:hypothetical protein
MWYITKYLEVKQAKNVTKLKECGNLFATKHEAESIRDMFLEILKCR